jgi:hypothetical protein
MACAHAITYSYHEIIAQITTEVHVLEDQPISVDSQSATSSLAASASTLVLKAPTAISLAEARTILNRVFKSGNRVHVNAEVFQRVLCAFDFVFPKVRFCSPTLFQLLDHKSQCSINTGNYPWKRFVFANLLMYFGHLFCAM